MTWAWTWSHTSWRSWSWRWRSWRWRTAWTWLAWLWDWSSTCWVSVRTQWGLPLPLPLPLSRTSRGDDLGLANYQATLSTTELGHSGETQVRLRWDSGETLLSSPLHQSQPTTRQAPEISPITVWPATIIVINCKSQTYIWWCWGPRKCFARLYKLMSESTMARLKKFYLRTLFADLRCENCKWDGRNTEEQKDLVPSPYYFTSINFFCCSTSLETLQAELDCDRKKFQLFSITPPHYCTVRCSVFTLTLGVWAAKHLLILLLTWNVRISIPLI